MKNFKTGLQKIGILLGVGVCALSFSACTSTAVDCSTATSAAACGASSGCVWNGNGICSAPRCDTLTSSSSCSQFVGNAWDPSGNCLCKAAKSQCKEATSDVTCNEIGCAWDNAQCLSIGTSASECKKATTQNNCVAVGCVWEPANINNNNKAQCLSGASSEGSLCDSATMKDSCTAINCTWSGTVCGTPGCLTLNQGQCAGFDKCLWDTTRCISVTLSCSNAKTKMGCGAPSGLKGCIWSGSTCISESSFCSTATTSSACGAIVPTGSCVWDPVNQCLSTASWYGDSCNKGTVQSSCVGLGCLWDGNAATVGTCLKMKQNCSSLTTQSGCTSNPNNNCVWANNLCVPKIYR